MQKILSICIPTYNRNKELFQLTQNFLIPALNTYEKEIEIIVCDNSDINIASANKDILDNRIIYKKNDINLGFGSNLLRCFNEATSTYIWAISDNDPILWNGFEELIEYLIKANSIKYANCIMLTYQTTDLLGKITYGNTQTNWNVTQNANIIELLNEGKVPFILFSSAVIRLNKEVLSNLEIKYPDNDYLQVILYLETLGQNSRVIFLKKPTIDYKSEYQMRYSILKISNSMSIVKKYIHEKFNIINDKNRDYRMWLFMYLNHRSGLYVSPNADSELWIFLSKLHLHLCFKNLLLSLVLILPKKLLQPISIWYRTYREMKDLNKYSYSEFKYRVSMYKKFMRNQ
jgi:hypothetical protein